MKYTAKIYGKAANTSLAQNYGSIQSKFNICHSHTHNKQYKVIYFIILDLKQQASM